MDKISLFEKAKYERMWTHEIYRFSSPGLEAAPLFLETFKEDIRPGDSLTDFGCGAGVAALSFLESALRVHLVDIADNCLEDKIATLMLLRPDQLSFTQSSLWEIPDSMEKSDWIYCVDVLEHLPSDKVETALAMLASKTKQGGLIQVFHKEEPFGSLIDETLHLTLQPEKWWTERISSLWKLLKVIPVVPHFRTTYIVGSATVRAIL
jgi:2-polyprenyl-3-methyl-5-hydroxy-6-metoxy-1,4-benzoquinol methylase